MTTSLTVKKPHYVQFNGSRILAVRNQGRDYVTIKPICDALGLDWSAQYRRMQRDEALAEAIAIMAIPSSGGNQEAVSLPLEMLNGWLFGISARRVRPELREKLKQYKLECYRVLFEHFHPNIDDGCISKSQRGAIYQALCSRTMNDGTARHDAWRRFNAHFNLNSYTNLPAARFDEALSYIETMPVEVKAIPAPGIDWKARFDTLFDTCEKRLSKAECCIGYISQRNALLRAYFQHMNPSVPPAIKDMLMEQVEAIQSAITNRYQTPTEA